MKEKNECEYRNLINEISDETRIYINSAIDIYEVLRNIDMKNEFGMQNYRYLDEDKVYISLLIANFYSNSNIMQIFSEYNISLEKVLKVLNIEKLNIKQLSDDRREVLFNRYFEYPMMIIKYTSISSINNQKLSPEYIMNMIHDNPVITGLICKILGNIDDAERCFARIDDAANKIMNIENEEEFKPEDHLINFEREIQLPPPFLFGGTFLDFDLPKYSENKRNNAHDEEKNFFSRLFGSNPNKSSLLEKYGDDLTSEDSKVYPAIGREKELENLMMGLVTGSSLLLGDAGVGKTAIVEGLAYLIKNNLAPKWFKDKKIIQILTDSLKAESHLAGSFEGRMNDILKESLENENVILFIDEIHTAMGQGLGGHSLFDIANSLKPYLTKGLRMIGATTKAEYEEYMKDEAFRRRFKCVEVVEPDKENTYRIIDGTIKKLEDITKVKFIFDEKDKKKIINSIIDITNRKNVKYNDPEYNPSISISILSAAFSHAAIKEKEVLDIEDIYYSIKSCDRIYESVRKSRAELLLRTFKNKTQKNGQKDINKVIRFPKR